MALIKERIPQGYMGHVWETLPQDEGGGVNHMASAPDGHNGPRCVNCGESVCEHCVYRGNGEWDIDPCEKSLAMGGRVLPAAVQKALE